MRVTRISGVSHNPLEAQWFNCEVQKIHCINSRRMTSLHYLSSNYVWTSLHDVQSWVGYLHTLEWYAYTPVLVQGSRAVTKTKVPMSRTGLSGSCLEGCEGISFRGFCRFDCFASAQAIFVESKSENNGFQAHVSELDVAIFASWFSSFFCPKSRPYSSMWRMRSSSFLLMNFMCMTVFISADFTSIMNLMATWVKVS